MMAVLNTDLILPRRDIPSYFDDDFTISMHIWKDFNRKRVLPYSGGYMEQPSLWNKVVDCVEDAMKEVSRWPQEK